MSPVVERLKERRKQLNLTQEKLAKRIGTTQAAIGAIEAGTRSPRIETIDKMARALDCEITVRQL